MLFACLVYFYRSHNYLSLLAVTTPIAVLETKESRNWQLIFMLFMLFSHRWKARLPYPHSASPMLF